MSFKDKMVSLVAGTLACTIVTVGLVTPQSAFAADEPSTPVVAAQDGAPQSGNAASQNEGNEPTDTAPAAPVADATAKPQEEPPAAEAPAQSSPDVASEPAPEPKALTAHPHAPPAPEGRVSGVYVKKDKSFNVTVRAVNAETVTLTDWNSVQHELAASQANSKGERRYTASIPGTPEGEAFSVRIVAKSEGGEVEVYNKRLRLVGQMLELAKTDDSRPSEGQAPGASLRIAGNTSNVVSGFGGPHSLNTNDGKYVYAMAGSYNSFLGGYHLWGGYHQAAFCAGQYAVGDPQGYPNAYWPRPAPLTSVSPNNFKQTSCKQCPRWNRTDQTDHLQDELSLMVNQHGNGQGTMVQGFIFHYWAGVLDMWKNAYNATIGIVNQQTPDRINSWQEKPNYYSSGNWGTWDVQNSLTKVNDNLWHASIWNISRHTKSGPPVEWNGRIVRTSGNIDVRFANNSTSISKVLTNQSHNGSKGRGYAKNIPINRVSGEGTFTVIWETSMLPDERVWKSAGAGGDRAESSDGGKNLQDMILAFHKNHRMSSSGSHSAPRPATVEVASFVCEAGKCGVSNDTTIWNAPNSGWKRNLTGIPRGSKVDYLAVYHVRNAGGKYLRMQSTGHGEYEPSTINVGYDDFSFWRRTRGHTADLPSHTTTVYGSISNTSNGAVIDSGRSASIVGTTLPPEIVVKSLVCETGKCSVNSSTTPENAERNGWKKTISNFPRGEKVDYLHIYRVKNASGKRLVTSATGHGIVGIESSTIPNDNYVTWRRVSGRAADSLSHLTETSGIVRSGWDDLASGTDRSLVTTVSAPSVHVVNFVCPAGQCQVGADITIDNAPSKGWKRSMTDIERGSRVDYLAVYNVNNSAGKSLEYSTSGNARTTLTRATPAQVRQTFTETVKGITVNEASWKATANGRIKEPGSSTVISSDTSEATITTVPQSEISVEHYVCQTSAACDPQAADIDKAGWVKRIYGIRPNTPVDYLTVYGVKNANGQRFTLNVNGHGASQTQGTVRGHNFTARKVTRSVSALAGTSSSVATLTVGRHMARSGTSVSTVEGALSVERFICDGDCVMPTERTSVSGYDELGLVKEKTFNVGETVKFVNVFRSENIGTIRYSEDNTQKDSFIKSNSGKSFHITESTQTLTSTSSKHFKSWVRAQDAGLSANQGVAKDYATVHIRDESGNTSNVSRYVCGKDNGQTCETPQTINDIAVNGWEKSYNAYDGEHIRYMNVITTGENNRDTYECVYQGFTRNGEEVFTHRDAKSIPDLTPGTTIIDAYDDVARLSDANKHGRINTGISVTYDCDGGTLGMSDVTVSVTKPEVAPERYVCSTGTDCSEPAYIDDPAVDFSRSGWVKELDVNEGQTVLYLDVVRNASDRSSFGIGEVKGHGAYKWQTARQTPRKMVVTHMSTEVVRADSPSEPHELPHVIKSSFYYQPTDTRDRKKLSSSVLLYKKEQFSNAQTDLWGKSKAEKWVCQDTLDKCDATKNDPSEANGWSKTEAFVPDGGKVFVATVVTSQVKGPLYEGKTTVSEGGYDKITHKDVDLPNVLSRTPTQTRVVIPRLVTVNYPAFVNHVESFSKIHHAEMLFGKNKNVFNSVLFTPLEKGSFTSNSVSFKRMTPNYSVSREVCNNKKQCGDKVRVLDGEYVTVKNNITERGSRVDVIDFATTFGYHQDRLRFMWDWNSKEWGPKTYQIGDAPRIVLGPENDSHTTFSTNGLSKNFTVEETFKAVFDEPVIHSAAEIVYGDDENVAESNTVRIEQIPTITTRILVRPKGETEWYENRVEVEDGQEVDVRYVTFVNPGKKPGIYTETLRAYINSVNGGRPNKYWNNALGGSSYMHEETALVRFGEDQDTMNLNILSSTSDLQLHRSSFEIVKRSNERFTFTHDVSVCVPGLTTRAGACDVAADDKSFVKDVYVMRGQAPYPVIREHLISKSQVSGEFNPPVTISVKNQDGQPVSGLGMRITNGTQFTKHPSLNWVARNVHYKSLNENVVVNSETTSVPDNVTLTPSTPATIRMKDIRLDVKGRVQGTEEWLDSVDIGEDQEARIEWKFTLTENEPGAVTENVSVIVHRIPGCAFSGMRLEHGSPITRTCPGTTGADLKLVRATAIGFVDNRFPTKTFRVMDSAPVYEAKSVSELSQALCPVEYTTQIIDDRTNKVMSSKTVGTVYKFTPSASTCEQAQREGASYGEFSSDGYGRFRLKTTAVYDNPNMVPVPNAKASDPWWVKYQIRPEDAFKKLSQENNVSYYRVACYPGWTTINSNTPLTDIVQKGGHDYKLTYTQDDCETLPQGVACIVGDNVSQPEVRMSDPSDVVYETAKWRDNEVTLFRDGTPVSFSSFIPNLSITPYWTNESLNDPTIIKVKDSSLLKNKNGTPWNSNSVARNDVTLLPDSVHSLTADTADFKLRRAGENWKNEVSEHVVDGERYWRYSWGENVSVGENVYEASSSWSSAEDANLSTKIRHMLVAELNVTNKMSVVTGVRANGTIIMADRAHSYITENTCVSSPLSFNTVRSVSD